MKVLIGCEFSGTVRDAFTARGHYAMSCDLLPTAAPGLHYQGDVFEAIKLEKWDMAIFHPPCTYLCSSGLHWNKRRPNRQAQTDDAIEFVKRLWNCGIPKIVIENPIGCLSSQFQKPTQIIQPWEFGHPESKATCFWIKGLPPLTPTNVLQKPECGHWENQTPSGQNKLAPGPDRWALRSLTYPGIAQAMANQWGSYTPPLSLFS